MRFRVVVAAALTMTLTAAPMGGERDSAHPKGAAEHQVLAEEHAHLNPYARRYVDLVILLGHHDEWTAGAFYGPSAWRNALAAEKPSVAEIRARAIELRKAFASLAGGLQADETRRRAAFMQHELDAFDGYAALIAGEHLAPEEEARRLYRARIEPVSDARIEALRTALDRALAGGGQLASRYAAYRARTLVPAARLEAVARASSDECKRRARAHVSLVNDNGLAITVPESSGRASGDLEYPGGFRGTIVMRRRDVVLDYALTTACHEGYAGHFLWALLREQRAAKEGWPELYVWPVTAGQTMEGTAELGPDVFFTADEARVFMRDTLAALAGVKREDAELNARVAPLDYRLKLAVAHEAARRFLLREATRAQAITFMREEGQFTAESAESWLRFTEISGAYALLYFSGRERFDSALADARAQTPEVRWDAYLRIVQDPWPE